MPLRKRNMQREKQNHHISYLRPPHGVPAAPRRCHPPVTRADVNGKIRSNWWWINGKAVSLFPIHHTTRIHIRQNSPRTKSHFHQENILHVHLREYDCSVKSRNMSPSIKTNTWYPLTTIKQKVENCFSLMPEATKPCGLLQYVCTFVAKKTCNYW